MSDLISRQAAILELCNWWDDIEDNRSTRQVIESLPTIDPVKHGKWEKAERDGCVTYSDAYLQCSKCGKAIFLAKTMNFCPNCGSRNEVVNED